MLRQMLQDALMTLQITGSLTAAIFVAGAPLALHVFRR
jgi:hypothetical protein